MKLGEFFISLFGFFRNPLKAILKRIFTQVVVAFFNQSWKIVLEEVAKFNSITDVTNAKKRDAVFKSAKKRIADAGIDVKDSVLNLVIEMAVNYLKSLRR